MNKNHILMSFILLGLLNPINILSKGRKTTPTTNQTAIDNAVKEKDNAIKFKDEAKTYLDNINVKYTESTDLLTESKSPATSTNDIEVVKKDLDKTNDLITRIDNAKNNQEIVTYQTNLSTAAKNSRTAATNSRNYANQPNTNSTATNAATQAEAAATQAEGYSTDGVQKISQVDANLTEAKTTASQKAQNLNSQISNTNNAIAQKDAAQSYSNETAAYLNSAQEDQKRVSVAMDDVKAAAKNDNQTTIKNKISFIETKIAELNEQYNKVITAETNAKNAADSAKEYSNLVPNITQAKDASNSAATYAQQTNSNKAKLEVIIKNMQDDLATAKNYLKEEKTEAKVEEAKDVAKDLFGGIAFVNESDYFLTIKLYKGDNYLKDIKAGKGEYRVEHYKDSNDIAKIIVYAYKTTDRENAKLKADKTPVDTATFKTFKVEKKNGDKETMDRIPAQRSGNPATIVSIDVENKQIKIVGIKERK
ncbi:MAG: hypothetical protein SZ59_C0005G0016 [candidate division TM6 bacterium GW2011_GWF2_28_16]|nr:MAG: hypothetical protein SZ59_C0005G0016 [candidate division TM6 bacterium GW2011_GWF2_28_16]